MFNQAQILGRVGKIDTKTLPSGDRVTNISMVTSKKYVSKTGEKCEKVTWHNISCFAKLAEITEKYVGIGDMLFVQGEIDNQKYTRKDGVEIHRTCIIAHELRFLPKTKEFKQEKLEEIPFNENEIENDEIPF